LGRAKGLKDLEEEVEAGKCVLNADGSGEFLRTVPVVALKIERPSDGKFLCQLAKLKEKNSHFAPSCMLPGTKMQIGDDAKIVAQTVLQDDLSIMAEHTEVGKSTVITETKDSASYGVKSVYLRSVFTCTLHNDVAAMEHFARALPEEMVDLPTLRADGGVQVFYIPDRKGTVLMYAWLASYEFKIMQAGECDEEIKTLDATAAMAGRDRRPQSISLFEKMAARLSKSENTARQSAMSDSSGGSRRTSKESTPRETSSSKSISNGANGHAKRSTVSCPDQTRVSESSMLSSDPGGLPFRVDREADGKHDLVMDL